MSEASGFFLLLLFFFFLFLFFLKFIVIFKSTANYLERFVYRDVDEERHYIM